MEIADVFSLPDEKRVGVQGDPMCGADDCSVFDFPETTFSFPSGKVFAVEKGFEAFLGERGNSQQCDTDRRCHFESLERGCRWSSRHKGFLALESETVVYRH